MANTSLRNKSRGKNSMKSGNQLLTIHRFFALVVVFLFVAGQHSVSSQRISRLWWNELKPGQQNGTNGLQSSASKTTNTLSAPERVTSTSAPETSKPATASFSATTSATSTPPSSAMTSTAATAQVAVSSAVIESPTPNEFHLTSFSSSTADQADSTLSDDELVSEASRMNSKMVRLGRNQKSASATVGSDVSSKFIRRATQFDDAAEQDVFVDPSKDNHKAAASTQFMKRSGFDGGNSRSGGGGGGSDRIWSYFDNQMGSRNGGGDQTPWKNAPSRPFPSFNQDFGNSRSRPSSSNDDIFARHFDKRPTSSSSSSSKKPSDDDRVVNFNFNRKKNTQEKEQWRQLIQSIFDSSPRNTPQFNGARVSSKSKFSDVPFNYGSGKPKSRSQTVNDLDGGKEEKTSNSALDEEEEDDVLKDEREENVDLSDKISEEEEENEKEAGRLPELPPTDEESEEIDDGRESSSSNRKRQATDNSKISQEDEEEESEDLEEENQYLQKANSSSIANIGNGSAKRSASANANGNSFGSRISRSNTTSPHHSFQSPGRRVQTEKPKFTMHFQLGKSAGSVVTTSSTSSTTSTATSTTESAAISDQLITDLVNDPSFSGDKSTTSYAAAAIAGAATTTTVSPLDFTPSTERFDVLDTSTEEDDLFERSQPVNRLDFSTTLSEISTTTESPRQSSSPSPKTASSLGVRTKTGKWMDNESFRVNDDRSMIMLPEEEDEEENDLGNEVPTGPSLHNLNNNRHRNVLTSRRNRMVGNERVHHLHRPHPSPPPARPKLTKRRLNSPSSSSTRTVRQDDLSDTDDISRLAQALPGTPGQDYPIFGVIPRTAFNCQEHKWPGYYADIETQCQVFHICQTGGRKNSFLCPNGTLFNQQLFVCDWWHNVQCDQVVSHYELNANIYDYNWESKRSSSMKKAPKISPKRSLVNNELEMRMGDLKERSDRAANVSSDSSMMSLLTTTLSPLEGDDDDDDNFSGGGDSVTTTEPNRALFTETVFGSRSAKKTTVVSNSNGNEAAEMLKKMKRMGGIKGSASEKLAKFNRLNSLSSASAKSSILGKSANLAAVGPGNTASSSFFSRYKYASHHSMADATSAEPKSAKLQLNSRSGTSSGTSPLNSVSSAFRSRQHSVTSSSSLSSSTSSSQLPFTSHLSSSSSLHRPKHYRA